MKVQINQAWKMFFLIASFALFAGQTISAQAAEGHQKVVIQVSKPDPEEHKIALNMAVNLQKHYGVDNIDVEIVAFGRGLAILTPKSPEADRVKSLAVQGIKFSACENTMKKVAKKTGKPVTLTEGVGVVPAGAARIIELQGQGYAYAAP